MHRCQGCQDWRYRHVLKQRRSTTPVENIDCASVTGWNELSAAQCADTAWGKRHVATTKVEQERRSLRHTLGTAFYRDDGSIQGYPTRM